MSKSSTEDVSIPEIKLRASSITSFTVLHIKFSMLQLTLQLCAKCACNLRNYLQETYSMQPDICITIEVSLMIQSLIIFFLISNRYSSAKLQRALRFRLQRIRSLCCAAIRQSRRVCSLLRHDTPRWWLDSHTKKS